MDLTLIRQITSQTSKDQYEKTLAFMGDQSIGVQISTKSPFGAFTKKLVLAEDETLEKPEEKPSNEALNPKVDFDLDYVMMLRAEIERLNNLISVYSNKVDESLPTLKTEIDLSIFDYSSAYEATVFYSKDWFANSLLSDDAKIDLAGYILTAVSVYCAVNTDTLSMISAGDANIILYIQYPRKNNS